MDTNLTYLKEDERAANGSGRSLPDFHGEVSGNPSTSCANSKLLPCRCFRHILDEFLDGVLSVLSHLGAKEDDSTIQGLQYDRLIYIVLFYSNISIDYLGFIQYKKMDSINIK